MQVPTWIQKELEIAVKETSKKEAGRTSRISIESDILPTYEPSEMQGMDVDVRPPKLFAPTPTPDVVASMPSSGEVVNNSENELNGTDRKLSIMEKRADVRTHRIRLAPVRMPIPRLQSATSTSSLQRLPASTTDTTSQSHDRHPGPLGLKKAYSNVDVTPSSPVKQMPSKKEPQSTGNLVSSVLTLQENATLRLLTPIRRTTSPSSTKSSTPSLLSSPRRRSSDQGSPDHNASGASQAPTSPASPSEGSEVGSDRDLVSPGLSSSSEGEVKCVCMQPQVELKV